MTKRPRATHAQVEQMQAAAEVWKNQLELAVRKTNELTSQVNNLTKLIRHYEQTLAIAFGRVNEVCTLYSVNDMNNMEEA